jgi:hypothetical protein
MDQWQAYLLITIKTRIHYQSFQWYDIRVDQQLTVCKNSEQNETFKRKVTIIYTHKKVDSAAHAIFFILICDDETILQ